MNVERLRSSRLLCALLIAFYLTSSSLAASAYGSGGSHSGNGTAPGQDASPPISTVAVNQSSAYPLGVAADRSGNVWFAEDNLDALAVYSPSNATMKTFPIPTPHHLAWIWFMIFDGNGSLWFSDASQQLLWRFDPATGAFANYTAGTAYPMVLHYDQQRNRMWFTSLTTSQVGYFDIAGESAVLDRVVNLSSSVTGSGVAGITVDSAGNAYVAEALQAKIVELDGNTLSIIRTWELTPGSQPVGLALDPARGRLWFTDHASSFFGYVELDSAGFVEYPTSLLFTGGEYAFTLPYWITVSSSGDVWFNEHIANRIGRFDPATLQLTEFNIPTNSSSPLMISVDDRTGQVWFTEFAGNALGEVDENSTLGVSVSDSIAAGTAAPTISFTSTPNPAPAAPPTVSITGESTGEPGPAFGATASAQESAFLVSVTANRAGPGNYTAAVCYQYAYVNQCGYLMLVVPPPGSSLPLLYSVYAATGVGVVVLVLALLRETRSARRRPRTA
ncbi:MAG: hypothetical protein JRN57_01130 [Nitrososphaerota archaeon]|nr:hypothetical protein [Nitrososphaerota archaeon]